MNNELIELLNELFTVINKQKNIGTDELVELEEMLGLEPNPDNYPKYIEGIKDIRTTRNDFISDFLSKISYGDIRLEADIITRPSYTVVLDDLQPKLQDIADFKITNIFLFINNSK